MLKRRKMQRNNGEEESPPKVPFKTRLILAFLDFIHRRAIRPNGTLNRRITNFLDRLVPANPTPRHGVSSHDIHVDPSRNLWFRLFVPTVPPTEDQARYLPVVFFFHGGGFAVLSPSSGLFDMLCRYFCARLNVVVVSANYRLIPEHRFPAQYEDGFDVIKFIDDNHHNIECWPKKADLGHSFFAGDSAGANLAHHVGMRFCKKETEFNSVKLTGLILLQPFFGGEERTQSELRLERGSFLKTWMTDWAWKAFLPDGQDRDHWAVNVSGPNAVDISGHDDFPPVVVLVGGLDPLRDWQLKYCDWLKSMGKEVRMFDAQNGGHGFYCEGTSETEMAFKEIKVFIEKLCPKTEE